MYVNFSRCVLFKFVFKFIRYSALFNSSIRFVCGCHKAFFPVVCVPHSLVDRSE